MEVDGADAAQQAVDGPHAEPPGGELHDQRHDRVGAGIVDALGPALGAVVVGGLEPVVTVGQHDAGAGDRVADGGEVVGIGDAPQGVVEAVLVGGGGEGWVGQIGVGLRQQGREAGGQGEPPDRVQVGAGRAQQLEAVALRFRQRALVRHHLARLVAETQRADHSGGALRAAVVTGEVHAVERERRGVVGDEHALGPPPGQRRGGPVVGVREDQPHRIVRVARGERGARLGLDHVVGWGADGGDVGGGVADSGEGKKFGHVAIQSGDGHRSLAHRSSGSGCSVTDRILTPDQSRPVREELAMQSAYDAFQEGNRLLASQNPHAAVIPLERARDLEPDKGSVRETLARAYFRTGRFTQASEEFERAVEIDPVNDYAHFGLGLCLMRRGDHVGARRHLKLAVAMRPDQQDYRAALARVTDDA